MQLQDAELAELLLRYGAHPKESTFVRAAFIAIALLAQAVATGTDPEGLPAALAVASATGPARETH